MSCFICEDYVFKSVAKVMFHYGIRQCSRGEYPLTINDLDKAVSQLAEINCRNYMERYGEEVEPFEVELFTDVPLEPVTVQDIKYCDCWCYQTEDYYSDDKLFKMVAEALEWAKVSVKYTSQEYDEANWG